MKIAIDKLLEKKRELIVLGALVALVSISAIYLNVLRKKEKEIEIQKHEEIINQINSIPVKPIENNDDLTIEEIKQRKRINAKANSDSKNTIEDEDIVIIEDEKEIKKEETKKEEIVIRNNDYSYNGYYAYCNNMDFSLLKEPGWMIYYDDNKYTSILGLDISEYNGSVDFYSLKEQGFDFVILRAGWRGSTEGGIYKDKFLDDYYNEAINAGLHVGYYFFSQAVNEDEAYEEAAWVIDEISNKSCDMFVAFDMETSVDGDGRSDYLGWEQKTNNALTFSSTIRNAGYEPMIYTNLDWAYNYYDCNMFNNEGIAIWLAQYNGYPSVNFKYAMWQYTASASIPGVALKGRTDINLMLVEK